MSKNLYNERFAQAPTNVNIGRSRFLRSQTHKTTLNAGLVVPFYLDEVLPGDTFDVSTSIVARMSTMLKPVMDDCYLDYYYFFVPTRLVWDHWREFMGENTSTFWTQPTEYSVPQLKVSASHLPYTFSVWDYFGLPISQNKGISKDQYNAFPSVSALPFRAYAKVWNDWFRDENTQTPISINTGDSDDYLPATYSAYSDGDYVTDSSVGGVCAPVNKFHDYFTSCLPSPQKGDPVSVPLGSFAPVTTYESDLIVPHSPYHTMRFFTTSGNALGDSTPLTMTGLGGNMARAESAQTVGDAVSGSSVIPTNLGADLSQATSATINQLREAFAIQRLLERDARGGTRYREILRSHFNVVSPDASLQVSEYLGGQRLRINVQSVAQTSESGDTPQANLAGYSITANNNSDFIKSFTEHGYVIGVMCIRTANTYQQGINRMFSRRRRFDYYFPALANLGEQAVLNKELYWNFGNSDGMIDGNDYNEGTFGFQERWAEYRYHPSLVTGQFRSYYPLAGLSGTLDSWHYASFFDNEPYLNSSFIRETKNNIDRTLAVTSQLASQFIADIQVNNMSTRPMPLYSVPGLIDHN